MGSPTLTVKQEGNNLTVERTMQTREGSSTTITEKYTLDGRTNVNTGMMNREARSTVTWTGNGRTLTFQISQTFERGGQTTEMKGTEVWSLTADGKTLTIESSRTTPQSEMKARLVYDK